MAFLFVLFFIQNVSQFQIGSNQPAYSLLPTDAYHIWKMRAIHHRFDNIYPWKRG